MKLARGSNNITASKFFIISVAGLGLCSGAHADQPFAADSKWMLGDWGGKRQELQDQGYSFIANHVAEAAANVHGGYDQNGKVGYADQFVLGMVVDLEKAVGISNAEFQLVISNRNGTDMTPDRITDPRTGQVGSTMEIAGRGQITRLSRMWYRQTYFDGALDWKLGRGSISEDFESFPCDFQNLSFCAAQAGVWAGDDWYSFPVSMWGTRLKYNLTPEWSVQAGVYEHNRTALEHDNGFKLSTSGANGVNLPVELIWKPQHGLFGLPGEYRLGAYHMNMNADDRFEDVNGQPRVLTGAEPMNRNERNGAWFIGRQHLTHFSRDAKRPLEVFVQAHANDKDTSYADRVYSAGIVATGIFDARSQDQIAFAVEKTHLNDSIRRSQKLLNQSIGATQYDDPAYTPLQGSEYNAELYYGVHVANWLTLRPNIQYIHNPGAVKQVDDAIVLGLKTVIDF
ncbi:carbohydrate porin [Pseudomonas syringae]|uniref:carbohydrate porin n=1 Tax=Pseudomonas syringae TaxID=317 RepID=UPI00215A2178|nr:carbohydrate porin [Pseudomonas syringae]MCR8718349.1 carbohydrate porin [Pseudomonas syringae]